MVVLQKKTEQALTAINDFNGTTYLKRATKYLERDRRQDLADTFKIITDIDKVDINPFLHQNGKRKAVDLWNLTRKQARTYIRLNSFTVRMADKWNIFSTRLKRQSHQILEYIYSLEI